ncbi:MAG: cytochrome b/b6 domain-containing protein [Alteromonadaceae bacterium]|nr:cytochrome b/b6 domain-containing protein [Alteromonadaceae bacterium]
MQKRLIWDIPTRLFHWLLVACILAQYLTAEVLDAIDWHFKIGYFTLGLILFRLLWGFTGTTYARFSQFLTGPGKVLAYSKTIAHSHSPDHAGHNPLGGWMVMVLLLLVALQGISGLFIGDDIINNGPYYDAVSQATRDTMNTIHHTAFNILLAAIALHVAAVVFYTRYKKQLLVPAMLHGKKATNEPGISSSRLLLALTLVIIVIATMYYVIEIAPPAPAVDADMYY